MARWLLRYLAGFNIQRIRTRNKASHKNMKSKTPFQRTMCVRGKLRSHAPLTHGVGGSVAISTHTQTRQSKNLHRAFPAQEYYFAQTLLSIFCKTLGGAVQPYANQNTFLRNGGARTKIEILHVCNICLTCGRYPFSPAQLKESHYTFQIRVLVEDVDEPDIILVKYFQCCSAC